MHESEDHLGKGNQLAEDQPDVDHLWKGGGGQFLHHADEDGRHHQHCCQVHTQGRLKEERLEEGGGKGDGRQKNGREVGGHHLTCDFPLHDKNHTYTFLSIFRYLTLPTPIHYTEYWHVQFLQDFELIRDKINGERVQRSHCHVDGAGLKLGV